MSKYLSYKHRHTLRRIMAMVFAVMLALSPLQAIAMAESSYFDPIEGASIEWEGISLPEYSENNNEETNTPSYNYPSETATDENNTAETGTEEQPSDDETPSTPPTGDGATDEPSNEENATEEPSGDAGSDNPSEDATDEPTDDATESGTDDATEPGTDEPTDEPTEEEPAEEPTDDDLLNLLPIIVPPIVFSGSNYWTVTFWSDSSWSDLDQNFIEGTELGIFRTPYGEVTTINEIHWPATPTGAGHFIGWYTRGSTIPVDLPTMVVEGNVDLYPRFATGGVLRFRHMTGDIINPMNMTHTVDNVTTTVAGITQAQRPNAFDAGLNVGQGITFWYNEAAPNDPSQRFFHVDQASFPNPEVHGLVVLRPASSAMIQVVFNLHGGMMQPAGTSNIQEVWAGNTVAEPADPVRHGWHFRHWSEYDPAIDEYSAYDNAFDFSTLITSPINLHAVWYGEHDVSAGFIINFFTSDNELTRTNDGLIMTPERRTSWSPMYNIEVPAGRYPLLMGDTLAPEQILSLVATYHQQANHSRVRSFTFTEFVPAGHLRQPEPLNAEGTAVVNLFFAPDIFDVVVDLSESSDAVLSFEGNIYNNVSAQHTFEANVLSNFQSQSSRLQRLLPMSPYVRTQAQIDSGFATISRPGHIITGWRWFNSTGNTGTFTFTSASTLPSSMRPAEPDNCRTITIRPMWQATEGTVILHTQHLQGVTFAEYRQLDSVNPQGNRRVVDLSDLLDGKIPFDEQLGLIGTSLMNVRILTGRDTPYFRSTFHDLRTTRQSVAEINALSNVVWNDDYTVAIRYTFGSRGRRDFSFNPGDGRFELGTPGLNNANGMVQMQQITGWPFLISLPTVTVIAPPTPIPPEGYVFEGWSLSPSVNNPLLAPNIDPVTGLFISNGSATPQEGEAMIFARYRRFPPQFLITDGLGNIIMTDEAIFRFDPENHATPPIQAGQSLNSLGITDMNSLILPKYHWVSGITEVEGRGTFSMWIAVNPSTGGIIAFNETIPMNAGYWTVFPAFNLESNTVTFFDENGNQHATRSVFTDSNLVTNTIARGGGTQRTMPPIPGTIPAGHRFVWTTESNGDGTVFTASTPVMRDVNVHAFFEPMVTITYTVKDWGNGVVGGYVTNAFSQTIPARFGRGASEIVLPTVENNIVPSSIATSFENWEFAGWFLAGAPVDAAPISTNPLFIPSRNPHTNLFETAIYEARFRAIINYVSENATLGTVTRAEEILFPNATAQGSTAQVTDPSGTRFVHWVSTRTGLPVNTDYVSGNTFTPSGVTTLIEPDTFIAIFAQSGATEIQFNVAPTPGIGVAGGTVNPPEQHLLAFQAASSSVSTTFPGFAFSGWSVGSNPGSMITDTASFSRTAPANGWDNASVADRTFYAHFTEAANIQISYAVASGRGTVSRTSESVAPITGNAAGVTATPAPGYRFDRWTTDLAGNNTVTGGATFTPSRRNIGGSVPVFEVGTTYFAHFVEDKGSVTIRYEAVTLVNHSPSSIFVGGSVDSPIQAGIDPFSTELEDIDGSTPSANAGFEFVRWAFAPAGTLQDQVPLFWWPAADDHHLTPRQEDVIGSVVPMFIDRTFYAIFQPTQFTITYNLNSGTHTGNPDTFNVTMPDIILADASRNGHTFLGWYTTNDFAPGSNLPRSTDINNPGSILNISPSAPGHVTLWARWQANAHTITYQSGNGEGADHVVDVLFGDTHTILTASQAAAEGITAPTGHHFAGWEINNEAVTTTTINVAGDVTLVAVWAPNLYNITYESGAGTGPNSVIPVHFGGIHVVLTEVPTGFNAPVGHHFDGWTIGGVVVTDATINVTGNVTLVARWRANSHTVTYVSTGHTGGSVPDVVNTVFGAAVTVLGRGDLERTGHTFGGWSDGTTTHAEDDILNIIGDVILTAVWNPIDYRVDFNENLQGSTLGDVTGFVPDSMTSVHYNATVGVPANENSLSRTGHTLLGWDRNANATTPEFPLANASNNSFTMPAADVTLYAIWEIQEREVIFVNNHNATDNTEHGRESTDYGSTLTLPTPPSRTGYDFVGWFTARTGGAPFTVSTVVREDTTVYARWQAHSHTITFQHDPQGGTGNLPATINTYFDEVETVPGQGSMVRNGYTFVGWRDSISNSVLTEDAPLTVSGNHVLTAVWSRDGRFAVIYNANWPSLGDQDGQVPTSAYGNDYYTGQTVTVLDNNTLEVTGHTFLGWSRDANAITPDYVDGNTFAMGTTHVTLYAVWQIQERTLTYSVGTGTGTPPAAQTVNWSSSVTVSGQGGMSKEGHTFGDWTDADGNPVAEDAVLSLTANMTLTAVWNINSYNVTYNANITGGAGAGAISGMPSPTTVSIVFGETHNITATPSRVGHTFAGWATSPTATASDVVTSITMVVGGVNLYAVWTPINYAVTFDLNLQGSNLGTIGGAVPNAITGRNYANVVRVPVNENSLTRTGHTLLGWSRNANATTATYVADDTFNMPAYDVTLYAVWQRQTREVTFIRNHDADDNTQATSVTVLYGASLDAAMPAELTRSGHDSLGWFDARASGTAFTSSTVVTETTNIYAQWQIQDRTITFANNETAEFISGSLPATITVDYGTVVSIPDVGITRRGYEFTVWTDTDDAEFASGDNWTLYEDLELTANWNRLERFAVIYNANGGILGNLSGDTPIGGDDYLPGETVTVLGYNTLARTGHTFLGWSTDTDATEAEFVEGETFAMLDANVTLYAVWQINQHEITVRHNTFAWDETYTDAVEYAYEAFTVYYGDSFEADIMEISNHNFDEEASDNHVITSMGDAGVEINLFYQQHAYAISLSLIGAYGVAVTEIDLEVNDRFPAQTDYNTLTWEDFEALFEITTVNLGEVEEEEPSAIVAVMALSATPLNSIPAPTLSSPNFYDVNFNSLTNGTPFVVTVEANWPNGQFYSLDIEVNIVDTVAPTISITEPRVSFYTDAPPANMQAVIDAFGITAEDNFDDVEDIIVEVSFIGGRTFNQILWTTAQDYREYALLVEAWDSSGNPASRDVVVVVVEAAEEPSEEPSDEPSDEPGVSLPPSGGGDDSDTGSNDGDDNNNAGGGNNNDVENDNNNSTTNNDTNNQDETESNDVDEDTTPETTLPETPATTAPTTSVVEAEAPVSEIATESAPLPLTTADNMIQYGDMWIELDDAGVPLGAWNWDEETEMWIFDENVPLGAFATAAGAGAVLGAASTMPETGLTSNAGILAILIAFALVIATAAFVLIKREQKNRNA